MLRPAELKQFWELEDLASPSDAFEDVVNG
jgi:hypothetical protein